MLVKCIECTHIAMQDRYSDICHIKMTLCHILKLSFVNLQVDTVTQGSCNNGMYNNILIQNL